MESQPETASPKLHAAICLALIAVVLAVYSRVATHEFISLDDPLYITDSERVQQGLTLENIPWAFQVVLDGNWIPLTWLSHMAAVEVFGLNAGAHLLINVVLHALNSMLLFLVLAQMTRRTWPSALVAALFALHPLHIESVAWVAERKDVLSTFFWMLTLLAYSRYAARPALPRYAAVVACFTLGLLAKSMLVTLPCVLLLLDFWPLRRTVEHSENSPSRLGRLLIEKLPLLAIAAGIAAVTIATQRQAGAMDSIYGVPMVTRLMNAAAAYAIYIRQTIWPFGLAVFYPRHAEPVLIRFALLGAALVATGLTAAAVSWKQRPYIAIGTLWYLGTLLPVIGLVQVGRHAHADRYTYVPLIGLFMIGAWALADLLQARPKLRRGAAAIAMALLLALSLRTWDQLSRWRNSETLFKHALNVAPKNSTAHGHYAFALLQADNLDSAIYHYHEALRLRTNRSKGIYIYTGLADAFIKQGKTLEAQWALYSALDLKPEDEDMRFHLANALLAEEDLAGAADQFARIVEANPQHVASHINLAIALTRLGKPAEAEPHFLQALRLEPSDADTHYNYALLLVQTARVLEAAHHLREALRSQPGHVEAQRQLDQLLGESGKIAPVD